MLEPETIIIGAGPAGLAAGISAPSGTLILERNAFSGKKLLLSGKGQCNFTNALPTQDFLKRMGEFQRFLKPAFYHFDNQALMQLLRANGCEIFIREDLKVFPFSLHSSEVRDTLLKLALHKGQSIEYHTLIGDVLRVGDSFVLKSASGRQYRCKKLILAAGGASYSQTGSDGNGYRLAAALGHSVIPSQPALTNIKVRDFTAFQHCAGISTSAAELLINKKRFQGDLLFTHQGLSGPLILDNSYLMQAADTIYISFIHSDIIEQALRQPQKRLSSILQYSGIAKALAQALLSYIQAPDLAIRDYKQKDLRRYSELLQRLPFRIESLGGAGVAMGDYGGVNLSEVKASTLESKKVPSLYFAGESLAYTLPTGGFSIQMAISTGMLAGALK